MDLDEMTEKYCVNCHERISNWDPEATDDFCGYCACQIGQMRQEFLWEDTCATENNIDIIVPKLQRKKRSGRTTQEKRIEKVFDRLNLLPNVLAIRLEVRQARLKKSGKFIYCKKQPFDYIVITSQFTWGFDAKQCRAKKFYWSKVPEHQIEACRKMQRLPGKRGGFLFDFVGDPVMRWVEDLTDPVTAQSGIAFDWEMFLQ